ncbi:hypothetical protein OID55_41985 (plasmid) [Streptomyces sp. NBC_00715]|uniref:hypothetical protein n=1 Tax=Streptomyces sp. NBC_00715 TaxID=2975811 RepID=UPI002F9126F6
MAKGPRTIGVLIEPPKPTWWRANRHKALLALGLLVGYWVGLHLHGTPASPPATPRPGHTSPGPLHITPRST